MSFPNHETVEKVRSTYPVGCRVVLDYMDDPYVHIPVGAQATVTGVDDAGNVMCVCDRCGMEDALEKAGMVETKPLMTWCAVELPAIGGGTWRR